MRAGCALSLVLDAPETLGFGEHLARYLIATYYYPGADLYHSLRFAAYLLHEVKKHAMYCGGASQVLYIDETGKTESLFPETIAQHELSCTTVVDGGAKMLLHFVDPMGWGFNLSRVDESVDRIGGMVKDRIREVYPNLVTQPDTPSPSSPAPSQSSARDP